MFCLYLVIVLIAKDDQSIESNILSSRLDAYNAYFCFAFIIYLIGITYVGICLSEAIKHTLINSNTNPN